MRDSRLPEQLGTKYAFQEPSEMGGIHSSNSGIYKGKRNRYFAKLVFDSSQVTTEILTIIQQAADGPVPEEENQLKTIVKAELLTFIRSSKYLSADEKEKIAEALALEKNPLSKAQRSKIKKKLTRGPRQDIFNAYCEASIGAIFHFLLGPQQPKIRLFPVDSGLVVASRLVENVKTLHDFHSRRNPEGGLGPHNQDYLEHFAGGLLYNLWVRNLDLHRKQVLVKENLEAIFIDFGEIGWGKREYQVEKEAFNSAFNAEDLANLPFVGPRGLRGGIYNPHNWLSVSCYVRNKGATAFLGTFRNDPNTYENPRFQSDLHWAMLRLLLLPKDIITIFAKQNETILESIYKESLGSICSELVIEHLEQGLADFIAHSASIRKFIDYLKNITILDLALMAREFRDACERSSKAVRPQLQEILGENLERIFEGCLIRLKIQMNAYDLAFSAPQLPAGEAGERLIQFALYGDHENAEDADLQILVLNHKIRRGEVPILKSSSEIPGEPDLAQKIRLGHELFNQLLLNFNLEDFRNILKYLENPSTGKPLLSSEKNPDPLLFLRLDGISIQRILTHYFPHRFGYENQCLALSFQKLLESARQQKIRKLLPEDYQSLVGHVASSRANELANCLLSEFGPISRKLSLAAVRENIVQNAYKFAKKTEPQYLNEDQRKALSLLAYYVRLEAFYTDCHFAEIKERVFVSGAYFASLFVNWAFDLEFFKSQIKQDPFLQFAFTHIFSNEERMRLFFSEAYLGYNKGLHIEEFFPFISKCLLDLKENLSCPLSGKFLSKFYKNRGHLAKIGFWGENVDDNYRLICLLEISLLDKPDFIREVNEIDLRLGKIEFLVAILMETKKQKEIIGYTPQDPGSPINFKQIEGLYEKYGSEWGAGFWKGGVQKNYDFIHFLLQTTLREIPHSLIEGIKEINLRAEKVEIVMEVFMRLKKTPAVNAEVLEQLRKQYLDSELKEISRGNRAQESTMTALVTAFLGNQDSEKSKDLAYLIAFYCSPHRNRFELSASQLYTYFETLSLPNERFREIKERSPNFFDPTFSFPVNASDLARLNLICRRIFLGVRKEDQNDILAWLKQIYSPHYLEILFNPNNEENCNILFSSLLISNYAEGIHRDYSHLLEDYLNHPVFKLVDYNAYEILDELAIRNNYESHHKEQLLIVHELLKNPALIGDEYGSLRERLKHHPLQAYSAKFIFELMNILDNFSKGKDFSVQENISNLISSLFYILSYPKEESTKLHGNAQNKVQQLARLNQHLIQRSEKIENIQLKEKSLGFRHSTISEDIKNNMLIQIKSEEERQKAEDFPEGSEIRKRIASRKAVLGDLHTRLENNPNLTWMEVDLELRKLENNADINYHKSEWKNRFRFFNTQTRKDIHNLRLTVARDCKV